MRMQNTLDGRAVRDIPLLYKSANDPYQFFCNRFDQQSVGSSRDRQSRQSRANAAWKALDRTKKEKLKALKPYGGEDFFAHLSTILPIVAKSYDCTWL